MDPFASLDDIVTEKGFENVGKCGDKGNDQNTKICKMAQDKGQRDTEKPNKTTVENGGDKGFATGTHGIIGRVYVGAEGHITGINADQLGCQASNLRCGVINLGEQTGDGKQNTG